MDCLFSASQMSGPVKKVSRSADKKKTRSSDPKTAVQNVGFFRRNRFALALFCCCFVVFGNSIFNEYAMDDEFYTAGSNKITQKGIKGIPETFGSRTFFNSDGSGYSYRPVAVASFALEIQFFGEKPRTSHLINVLLYAFTLVLLFSVLRRWFKAQGDWFSFFVCLIFLVHPIHTEVVANIKCRDELLAFFFALLAMRLTWMQIETGKKWVWPLISVAFILAVLSKTSIAPFFALIPFSVWYFTDKKWWQAAIYVLPLVAAVLIVKFAMLSRIPEMSRTLQGFENPIKDMGFGQLSATAAYVLGRYLWLLILPHPLIFYYGLNEVPVCSWDNPFVIISTLIYIAIAVWTFVELRKKSIAGFGLIFFGACIIFFSNLFGAAPGIMAERFAYSASLGFIIMAVDMIFRFTKQLPASFDWSLKASSKTRTVFLCVILLFSLRSIIRNEAWEDKETLYRNDVELAPESAKINMLLASLLSSKAAQMDYEAQRHQSNAQQLAGMNRQTEARIEQDSAKLMRTNSYALFQESRTYYRQATKVFPDYYTAWSNLGTAYYFTREYRLGVPYFKQAIVIKKDYAAAYYNLGMSYEQIAKEKGTVDNMLLDSALYFFREGLKQDSSYVASAEHLSRVLFQYKRDSAGAMDVLNRSVEDNPKSAVPWNAMSSIYFQSKDTASGVAALEMAAKLDPENFTRLGNLANYFYTHGQTEKANQYKFLYDQQKAAYEEKQKLLGKNKRR